MELFSLLLWLSPLFLCTLLYSVLGKTELNSPVEDEEEDSFFGPKRSKVIEDEEEEDEDGEDCFVFFFSIM